MRNVFQVDVFTDRVLGGNPAGVVLGADGLDDATLHAIARELGAGETAFVTAPTRPAATHRVRFFARGGEVALSGHAALAVVYLLARQTPEGSHAAPVLECRAGDLAASIERGARGEPARLGLTLGKPMFAELPMRGVVSQSVTLPPDVIAPRPAPSLVSVGEWVAILPVTAPDVLAHPTPIAAKIGALGGSRTARGIYVVALDAEAGPVGRASARFFGAPSLGVAEDAGSGVAAGALAGWLVKNGRLAPGAEVVVTQGEAMHRPCTIVARVGEGGRAWIGGGAVLAFEARLNG